MTLLRLLLLPALTLGLAVPAEAGSIAVSPIRIDLPADGRPEVVRVRNETGEATLIQVEAVAWSEDVDSAPRAHEILAVPPVFELAGSSEQVLRLALRQPLDGPTEKAYRLLITEVPRQAGAPNALVFAVRLNLPVFVTPAGAAPEAEWTVQRAPSGEAELVLTNRGHAHLRIEELSLRAEDGSSAVFASDQIAYALPGDAKVWALGQPLGALPPALEVSAKSNHGPLVAPVPRAGG